jgi:hypothetical protein
MYLCSLRSHLKGGRSAFTVTAAAQVCKVAGAELLATVNPVAPSARTVMENNKVRFTWYLSTFSNRLRNRVLTIILGCTCTALPSCNWATCAVCMFTCANGLLATSLESAARRNVV